MKSSINVKAISGFAEYLPNEQIVFSEIKNLISVFFKRNGFIPLDTSVIERAEVLFAKEGGETAKQVYMVKNKNSDKDDEFALRFDHTVPFARYVANNYSKLTFPFARYAIGKVYRGERAQKGRYREFYQADFDIVSNKMSAGSDIIHASYAYYLLKEILSFLGKDALKQKFIEKRMNKKPFENINRGENEVLDTFMNRADSLAIYEKALLKETEIFNKELAKDKTLELSSQKLYSISKTPEQIEEYKTITNKLLNIAKKCGAVNLHQNMKASFDLMLETTKNLNIKI